MKKIARLFWGNAFFKGGLFFTVSSFIGNIINYFFNIFAARGLGPQGYGEIAALFSYITLFSVPMLVMTMVIIEKIGSRGNDASRYARMIEYWCRIKVSRWWPVIILGFLCTPFLPGLTNLSPVSSYFLLPISLLSFVTSFYTAVLQGLKLFIAVSLIGIATVLIKLTGSIIVVTGFGGLQVILLFLTASILFSLGISAFVVHREYALSPVLTNKYIQKRIVHVLWNRQVLITLLSVFSIALFNNIDVVIVKKLFDPGSAGFYGSWSLLAKIITYAMGPITMVSYVFFSHSSTRANHEKVLTISLCILGCVGIVSYVVYTYASAAIVQLFFGPRFAPVMSLASSASIFGTLYSTVMFINNYFIAKKSKKALILIILLPVYIIGLIFADRTLQDIIKITVSFAAFTAAAYLVAYLYPIAYNVSNGKQER